MSDEVDQADEIQALQSIYNEEELSCTVEDDGLRTGKLSAFIIPPPPFQITFATNHHEETKIVMIPIEHLPPVILSFKFPKDYPSVSQPLFTLSCPWLTAAEITRLSDRLEDIWNDKKGTAILYLWMMILKEETLNMIGVSDTLDITNLHEQYESEHISESQRPSKDPRVKDFPIDQPLPQFMESFNEARHKSLFLRNIFVCTICYQETPGVNCLEFNPCGHVYCKPCMEQYFKVRISENSSIPCPYEKCPSEANTVQIKEVVGEELSQKYDKMLLQTALDRMVDITYCPRISCGSPVLKDGDDKMAACLVCNYMFCIDCRKSYHGVDFCPLRPDEIGRIIQLYQDGDDKVREKLEKQYGLSRNIQKTTTPLQIERIVYDYENGSDEDRTKMELRYGKELLQRLQLDIAGELQRIINQFQNGSDETRSKLKKLFGYQEIQKLIKFNVNNLLSIDWMDRNAKLCPKCKAPIQRISGCNHMVCWKCQTSFCWHCLCYTCIG